MTAPTPAEIRFHSQKLHNCWWQLVASGNPSFSMQNSLPSYWSMMSRPSAAAGLINHEISSERESTHQARTIRSTSKTTRPHDLGTAPSSERDSSAEYDRLQAHIAPTSTESVALRDCETRHTSESATISHDAALTDPARPELQASSPDHQRCEQGLLQGQQDWPHGKSHQVWWLHDRLEPGADIRGARQATRPSIQGASRLYYSGSGVFCRESEGSGEMRE